MRNRLGTALSLGSIAVIFIVGTAYLTFGIARVTWFDRYITVTMQLTDGANLEPRSPVLLSGIRIGQVTTVANTATGVDVEMRIDRDYRVPADSGVTIEQLSALGEPYITFRPRGDAAVAYLSDGQRIRADQVQLPISIPDMAHTVTTLLSQFDPQAIGSLIQTFSQALAGTDALVPELARSSDLLAATLISRAPKIRELLTNAQVPGPDVTTAGAAMREAGPQLGEFGAKVKDVVGSLERLLNARPVPQAYITGTGLIPFLGALTDYLNRIGPDLQQMYPTLGPLLTNTGTSLRGFDLSALITQALHSVDQDGAIRLQITMK